MRGIFHGILPATGARAWHAELLESRMVWYEVMVNRLHPEVDARASAVNEIRRFRREHEGYFNRRFVYFICGRPRVRFSTRYPAAQSSPGGDMVVHLEAGAGRELHRCSIAAPHLADPGTGEAYPLQALENTDKHITLTYSNGVGMVFSVHQFLREWEVNLGLHTRVHYVGFTRNPDTRALNGAHQGLTRTLYRTRESASDIFVFYNTFAVRCVTQDTGRHATFVVSNAMTDEVDIDTEGLILETSLISYFKPDCQGDLQWEEARLKNLLSTLATRHGIRSLGLTMAFRDPCEYFSFCSDAAAPSLGHAFQVRAPE